MLLSLLLLLFASFCYFIITRLMFWNILFMLFFCFVFLFSTLCILGFVFFCVLFHLLCYLFPIFVQLYRPLPPGGNPFAVSTHLILSHRIITTGSFTDLFPSSGKYNGRYRMYSRQWESPSMSLPQYFPTGNENIPFLILSYPLTILGDGWSPESQTNYLHI